MVGGRLLLLLLLLSGLLLGASATPAAANPPATRAGPVVNTLPRWPVVVLLPAEPAPLGPRHAAQLRVHAASASSAAARRRLAGACAGATLGHKDSTTSTSALSSHECAAWQAGFDAMGAGAGWVKCGDKREDPCGCSTVKCAGGRITGVDLNANNMTGVAPAEWSALTSLAALDLHSNKLTGPLPTAWSALTTIKELRLGANQLTGELRAAWSAFTQITYLDLANNQLTGPLPTAWSALTQIKYCTCRATS